MFSTNNRIAVSFECKCQKLGQQNSLINTEEQMKRGSNCCSQGLNLVIIYNEVHKKSMLWI